MSFHLALTFCGEKPTFPEKLIMNLFKRQLVQSLRVNSLFNRHVTTVTATQIAATGSSWLRKGYTDLKAAKTLHWTDSDKLWGPAEKGNTEQD